MLAWNLLCDKLQTSKVPKNMFLFTKIRGVMIGAHNGGFENIRPSIEIIGLSNMLIERNLNANGLL